MAAILDLAAILNSNNVYFIITQLLILENIYIDTKIAILRYIG